MVMQRLVHTQWVVNMSLIIKTVKRPNLAETMMKVTETIFKEQDLDAWSSNLFPEINDVQYGIK